MSKNIIIIISLSISLVANAQEKIKVILLGTFHYGFTSDHSRTDFPDLFSQKRQDELNAIAKAIVADKVDKIFIEWPAAKQQKLDSSWNAFKNWKTTDTITARDEIYQVAFRAAKMNDKIKLVAVDYRQELPFDTLQAYEKAHEKDTAASYPFFEMDYPFSQKLKNLSELSLTDYYIQLNSLYSRQQNQFDYVHYALGYGKDNDYTGESFTSSWYDRNLKIFTNILRNIDLKNDKVILVLFGSSHNNTMRNFFELHPSFEIEEVDALFKQ